MSNNKLFDDDDSSFNSKRNFSNNLISEQEIKELSKKSIEGIANKPVSIKEKLSQHLKYKVLIVDDEQDVIAITKLALNNFYFQGHKLQFFEANNIEVAKEILNTEDDIALIFLDVVMKQQHDGLELVKYIRNQLNNNLVHIILRTGQPGHAPEKDIILNYNINFYQTKSDLTERRLHTITASNLRSYAALKDVKNQSLNLEKEVEIRTEMLMQKNAELQKVNATKNKMFSIIAHDLVNPFNSLIGFSDLLMNNCQSFDEGKIKEMASIIYETSDNTHKLLTNLLEWSRTQTGTLNYKPELVKLNSLIVPNIKLLKNSAQSKSIEIIYKEEKEELVFCDSNMINTVIRNLISNAIKYTEKGFITISTKNIGGVCKLIIEDTGVGIRKDKINNLFTICNISTEGTSGERGTGVGLLLCKEFVDLNKGKIFVESEVGKGSRFTISLPSKETV